MKMNLRRAKQQKYWSAQENGNARRVYDVYVYVMRVQFSKPNIDCQIQIKTKQMNGGGDSRSARTHILWINYIQ